MQHISTVTVGSGGAASITFSAIPDTFTDLYVVLSGRTTRTDFAVTEAAINFNSTGANMTSRRLFGYSSTVASQSRTNIIIGVVPSASNTSNTFSNNHMYIPNYRAAVAKSVSIDGVSETNNTGSFDNFLDLLAGLWNDTSAITSITIGASGFNFVEGSSASLYGILAGSDGIVSVS